MCITGSFGQVRRSSLLIGFLPLSRRWAPNDVIRTDLSIVFRHHTLQPLDSVCHVSICPFKLIKNRMDAFRSLFSQHPHSNLPVSYEVHHMVLYHVEFGSDCGSGESRSVMREKLINVGLCGEHMDVTARKV